MVVVFSTERGCRTMSLSYRCLIGIAAHLLLAFPCVPANDASGPKLYLIVTRQKFTEAAQPLIEKRRAEGFEVVVSLQPPAEAIAALPRKPDLLLLIGDAEPGMEKASWYVPTQWRIHHRWRKTGPADKRPPFPSDTAWGDLDGDLFPDIPVGRLPVRTVPQLKRIVGKILEYERQPPSLDDLRLPIGTGDPEPSAARDGALWAALGHMATDVLLGTIKVDAPRWVQPWLLSASPKHPLRGWPPDQPDLFSEQLQRGGFFARLEGHGWMDAFYFLRFKDRYIRYTIKNAAGPLASGKPGPPLVIGACYCGNFALPEDCLAESLLRMPAGPVAVIAATTVADSLPGYLSGRSFLQLSKEGKRRRLGEFWFQVQQGLPKDRNLIIEKILINTEGYVGEKPDLVKLQRDYMLMHVLLGDPAMRLRIPQRLHGKIRRHEDGWRWEVRRPTGATRLHVSFRAAGQRWPRPAVNAGKQQLRRLLQAANETFAFHELPSPPGNGTWKGVINREGILRLVAFTPKGLHVVALNLKLPKTSPVRPVPDRR